MTKNISVQAKSPAPSDAQKDCLSIAAVERETGISKDVLRKWESRYGFPRPERDALGERKYPPNQVARLRLIKRLMDAGMRPARLMQASDEALISLSQQPLQNAVSAMPLSPELGVSQLRHADPLVLRQLLRRALLRQGLESFVLDTLMPLNVAVGEAWARGEFSIHEEHLYTEVVQVLLHEALAQLNTAGPGVRILLTTLPGEQHGLGLLMAACVLALHGAQCVSLGLQTPVQDIAAAANAHAVDVVALSFSPVYPLRQIVPALQELKAQLTPMTEVWAGGSGVARVTVDTGKKTGIRILASLTETLEALKVKTASSPR